MFVVILYYRATKLTVFKIKLQRIKRLLHVTKSHSKSSKAFYLKLSINFAIKMVCLPRASIFVYSV